MKMTVIIMDNHGERLEDLRELKSIESTETETELDFRPYMHMETIYEPAQKG
jgi:ribosome maturation protein Sdo1